MDVCGVPIIPYGDDNDVVFVMEKYDPQRKTAFAALESSQKAIEDIKIRMLDDLATGCPVMRFDVSTLNTLPETEFVIGIMITFVTTVAAQFKAQREIKKEKADKPA